MNKYFITIIILIQFYYFLESRFKKSAKTYYWKVIVKDDKGGKTAGQVWDFKTD